MVMQGCLAWEDIEEREENIQSDSIIPMLVSVVPPDSPEMVEIDKDCISYQFKIDKLIDARTGEDISNLDVYMNWFLDYSTNPNVQSAVMNYTLNVQSTTINIEPTGTIHRVDLRISDQPFLTEGEDVRINWDVPENANVEQYYWILEVVDNDFVDPNCSGYVE